MEYLHPDSVMGTDGLCVRLPDEILDFINSGTKPETIKPFVNYRFCPPCEGAIDLSYIKKQMQNYWLSLSNDCQELVELVEALKLQDGSLSNYHELNEILKARDVEIVKLMINSLSSDLQYNGELQQSNDHHWVDNAFQRIYSRYENMELCTKIYLCKDCHYGTSYNARYFSKNLGTWTCNYCRTTNVPGEDAEYYIYNSFKPSLMSLLSDVEVYSRLQKLLIHEPMDQGTGMSYLGFVEALDNKIISRPRDFNPDYKYSPPRYFTAPTFRAVITCDEI